MYEIRGESMITSEQTIKTLRKQSVTLKRELAQVQTSRILERRAASNKQVAAMQRKMKSSKNKSNRKETKTM